MLDICAHFCSGRSCNGHGDDTYDRVSASKADTKVGHYVKHAGEASYERAPNLSPLLQACASSGTESAFSITASSVPIIRA
jgi:hypothetical protein